MPSHGRRRSQKTSSAGLSLFLGLLLLSAALPLVSRAQLQPEAARKHLSAEFVPGEILVRYRTDEAAQLSESEPAPALAVGRARKIPFSVERFGGSELVKGLRLVRVPEEETLEAIEALKSRADVLYAEPNYVRRKLATPTDPRFKEMWAMKNTGQAGTQEGYVGVVGADIDAEAAWNLTKGSRSVVVGVVDEGIDISHPDLQANIWKNPGEVANNGVDDDANGFVDDTNGWDFFHNDKTVYDGSGAYPSDITDSHGTHVAGTIGAVGNNGVGVTGVNWQVSLMSLKILGVDDGSMAPSSVLVTVRAYNYAKKMRDLWASSGGTKGANIRVLNNSYGGGGFSQAELDAINALNTSGILFVAAAGNNGSNNDALPVYPASYQAPNLISVASTHNRDGFSQFSNYGPLTVHLAAPGEWILSTTPGGTYDFFSGTSMASPHVAGTAALICAANPNITVKRLRAALLYSGDSPSEFNPASVYSGRRLNAFRALQSAAENDTTAPAAVGGLQIQYQSERQVRLLWTAPGDDLGTGQASLYEIRFNDTQPTTPAQFDLGMPLPAPQPNAAGNTHLFTVSIPYRHPSGFISIRALDNAGNAGPVTSVPVSVAPELGDPYVVTQVAATPLSTGGTPISLHGDDVQGGHYYLPFEFPFKGANHTFVAVSTNGVLYVSYSGLSFPGPSGDDRSSLQALNGQQQLMIAGLWDDLRTDRRAGDDIYVVKPDANRVIFRWQAVTYDTVFPNGTRRGENPVSFEIELQRNGTIIFRYGAGNQKLFPVVGVSLGEPDAYSVLTHTSEDVFKNLTNAQTVVFTPYKVANATITSLTMTPATVVGGKSATGKVTLSAPAPLEGATISLSENLAAATAPASVTVPAGATSATFPVSTTAVSANQPGTVTAKFKNSTKTVPLTVVPVLLQSITLNPTSVAGGNNVTGTVALSGPAPAGGVAVKLSDDLSATTVPTLVTVPAGATTQTFAIPTAAVATSQAGTVTASYGSLSKTAALTVRPVGVASLTLSQKEITGGGSATATVVLERAAAGNQTVTLNGNVPAAVVPASVVVPSGATTKTFIVTTKSVTAVQAGVLTATLNGTGKETSFSVNPVATPCAATTFTKSAVLPFKLIWAAAGDFNKDGKMDLAGTTDTGLVVLTGNGLGGFTQRASYVGKYAEGDPVVADFNNDGKLDIAATYLKQGTSIDPTVRIMLGDGTGLFKVAGEFVNDSWETRILAASDFNNDGKADLVLHQVFGGTILKLTILPGDGLGGFGAAIYQPEGIWANAAAAADFNQDGKQDLALVNYYGGAWYNRVRILLGDGTGHFGAPKTYEMGTNSEPYDIAAGDFNKDGRTDLAVVMMGAARVAVMQGNGQGGFGTPVKYPISQSPQRVVVGDFNTDNRLDVAVAHNGQGAYGLGASVLMGDGAGVLGAAKTYATQGGIRNPFTLVVADFNGDRRPDLAAPLGATGLVMMLNTCSN